MFQNNSNELVLMDTNTPTIGFSFSFLLYFTFLIFFLSFHHFLSFSSWNYGFLFLLRFHSFSLIFPFFLPFYFLVSRFPFFFFINWNFFTNFSPLSVLHFIGLFPRVFLYTISFSIIFFVNLFNFLLLPLFTLVRLTRVNFCLSMMRIKLIQKNTFQR